MRLLHSAEYTSTQFDDPNLSRTGLVPVLRLMQRCNLASLVGEHLHNLSHRRWTV
jgi:hypothetical protein